MAEMPGAQLRRNPIEGTLSRDKETLKALFHAQKNRDILFRDARVCGFDACLMYLEGMAGNDQIDQHILRPAMHAEEPKSLAPEDRAEYLRMRVLYVSEAEPVTTVDEAARAALDGKTVMLIDGCKEALSLETREYEKRPVGRTYSESVVMGAQEGFVENLRTNLTLIRRILRSEALVNEMTDVGTQTPTRVAMLYLEGVARPELVDEVRKRVKSLKIAQCPGSGYLVQMIEDHPFSLFPQMLQTERPDRASSCLSDGCVALVVDGSPYAIIAPMTLFGLLHASDDSFLRWQYGTFMRLVRLIGLLLSLVMPALYIAVTMFHAHMMPMELLTAIAETRAKVPFPVLIEVVIMEASFFLINEAGTRMPTLVGPALGIVGALILGQAAVAASIISPILIIVIALTGLGNYAMPSYSVGLGLQIARLALVVFAALLGLQGIMLCLTVLAVRLSSMRSFGQPYLAPIAPYRPHNPDVLLRLPLWLQNRRLFTARPDSWIRNKP